MRGPTPGHAAQPRTRPLHLSWQISDNPYGRLLDEGRYSDAIATEGSASKCRWGTTLERCPTLCWDQLRDHLHLDNELRRGVRLRTQRDARSVWLPLYSRCDPAGAARGSMGTALLQDASLPKRPRRRKSPA